MITLFKGLFTAVNFALTRGGGVLVPELINAARKGITAVSGGEYVKVQDQYPSLKGWRTYAFVLSYVLGHIAAATMIGFWELPPYWNEIHAGLLGLTMTAKQSDKLGL